MGDDLRVANAARVSFKKESEWVVLPEMPEANTLEEKVLSEKDEKLIRYLANHNHWTPFSHPQITIHEKVPIFVARQRFKHMVGFTYNEVSRRYVDDAPELFFPKEWRGKPVNAKQGSEGLADDQDGINKSYDKVMSACLYLYNAMIKEGVAPEQARMVLPQSMYTEYISTGSLAAYARAYKLRSDDHSQVEIRELAKQWDEIIRPLFPVSWSALVG